MKKIKLTKGQYTLIDDEDYSYLIQYKWHLTVQGYAATDFWQRGKSVQVLLHRHLMNLKKHDGLLVDHINQNKLDNRRSNLRLADKSLNAWNSKLDIRNTSGIRNIYYDKSRDGWRYYFKLRGIIYQGRASTKSLAIQYLNQKKKDLKLYV